MKREIPRLSREEGVKHLCALKLWEVLDDHRTGVAQESNPFYGTYVQMCRFNDKGTFPANCRTFYFSKVEDARKARQIITNMIEEQVKTHNSINVGETEKLFWQKYLKEIDNVCFIKIGKIIKTTKEEIE